MRTKFVVRYNSSFGETTETFYLIQKIINDGGNINREYYWLSDFDIISEKSFTSEITARYDIFEKYNNNNLISMGFYQE